MLWNQQTSCESAILCFQLIFIFLARFKLMHQCQFHNGKSLPGQHPRCLWSANLHSVTSGCTVALWHFANWWFSEGFLGAYLKLGGLGRIVHTYVNSRTHADVDLHNGGDWTVRIVKQTFIDYSDSNHSAFYSYRATNAGFCMHILSIDMAYVW